AALAAAPAAPTAPAEDDTVATINGQGYKSFDEAVKAAQSGDILFKGELGLDGGLFYSAVILCFGGRGCDTLDGQFFTYVHSIG
ncbi:hypothetical protein ACSTB0_13530, partial [Faecalibacterium wellingii]|uniref:hypothetical protein n=1 Tax=Faecalibacterium wellingii TaxID=2929491 RepID=UPI003ED8965A